MMTATQNGLSEWLQEAGYEPIAVGSFHEARKILRSSPPDVLITDVRLGEYNGLQLIINNHSRIPAIVISGFNDPVLEAQAKREGAVFLIKPLNLQTLLDAVRVMLAGATDVESMDARE
jgi:DNA-binding NtrC family response regulator